MGDMKTPDFDDLLAAFDIPDIDAKEAIQSNPDEPDSGHANKQGTSHGVVLPHASGHEEHSNILPLDPPVVSVIVKNRVRQESFSEQDSDTDRTERESSISRLAAVASPVTSGPSNPAVALVDSATSLMQNGYGTSSSTVAESLKSPDLCLPQRDMQTSSNGELWSPHSPKTSPEISSDSGGSKSLNIFSRLRPLVTSPSLSESRATLRERKSLQKRQHSQEENKKDAVPDITEVSCDVSDPACDRNPFFTSSSPKSASLSLTQLNLEAPNVSSGAYSPPSPVSPASAFPAPSLFSTSQKIPQGQGSMASPGLDSEDSDPDIGSPLIIQESPESPSANVQKSNNLSPLPLGQMTPEPQECEEPHYPESTALPSSWSPSQAKPVGEGLNSQKKSPDHIVEERDSPQSPEPEALSAPKSNKPETANVSSSNPPLIFPACNSPRSIKEEATMPKISSIESPQIKDSPESPIEEEGDGQRGNISRGGSCRNSNSGGGSGSSNAGSPLSTSSRPLKVRIKTIKTSTGGITRTITHVASAQSALASEGQKVMSEPEPIKTERTEVPVYEDVLSKSAESSKKKIEQASKIVSLQLGNGTRIKGTILPVSTIEDASTAMLMAASKVQNNMVTMGMTAEKSKRVVSPVGKTSTSHTVAKVTTTAVAVTRPALSLATQKVVNGGATILQASKPASIVNSSGAVISRSQSSLVEAFNKILNSKNLLPSYRPDLSPPAEWSLGLPPTGYRCLECGDSFALEKSLARHYDRRSMRIEVTCNHCAKRLVFFNKCSLLLHAREHKDRGLVMQCSHLVMKPVSLEQMIGQQDVIPVGSLTTTPVGLSVGVLGTATATSGGLSAGTHEGGTKTLISTTVKKNLDVQHPALPLILKKGEFLQYHNLKCPECMKQFKSKLELISHFQEVKLESGMSCAQCSPALILPNPCSAAAHTRMHKHQSPHVCPECGGISRATSFQTHLKDACLHFSRRVGYKCSSCHVIFGGLNSIKSHIQTAHCEVFYKCPTCPMAFKSASGALTHINTQHPGLSSPQPKMIYKCVMCDTVFTHKPLLHTHFDTHLAKQKVPVFKCPDCTKLYAQKTSLMEHVKSTHRSPVNKGDPPTPSQTSASVPQTKGSKESRSNMNDDLRDSSSFGEEDEDDEEEVSSSPETRRYKMSKRHSNTNRSKNSSGRAAMSEWTCRKCHAWFPERDEYISHMKKEHGQSVKKFPCRLCERSFCSAPSLRRHVRVNHEGIKRVFPCQYCTEGKRTFSSRLILEKHIRLRHGIKVWDQTQGEEASNSRVSSDNEGIVRKRKGPQIADSSSDTEGPGGRRTPIKTRRREKTLLPPCETGSFQCQKCGYTTESQDDFQEHIPQHRTDETSHQCLQCGLCFASQSSLNRHRFITHRVKELGGTAADKLHGSEADSPETEQGESQQGTLSCQVCGKHFEKPADLNTHFRTHGMAFIKTRKTGGSEK
ncbi:ZN687 protein, partial [Polypterus senegalus]|nr:ZN687 protein [Polypterus senegalus]